MPCVGVGGRACLVSCEEGEWEGISTVTCGNVKCHVGRMGEPVGDSVRSISKCVLAQISPFIAGVK